MHIVVFKHSDCKFKHLYAFNLIPDLANPECPEMNPEQKYSKFPCDAKLSMDCVFLSVTLACGEVKVLKMPPILSPMESTAPPPVDPVAAAPKDAKVPTGKPSAMPTPTLAPSTSGTDAGKDLEVVKADLDKFQFQDLNVADCTITSIAPKKRRNFVDPFVYKENQDDEVLSSGRVPTPTEAQEPTQLLGNKRIQDEKGGDAGCLYKLPQVMPHVFFIRASCIAKASAVFLHPEMNQTAKGMKQFFVTTGVGLSYHNDFEVHIYNIQKPTKEAVIQDFTYDYFHKITQQRKMMAKKKVEKNLAALVSQITAG